MWTTNLTGAKTRLSFQISKAGYGERSIGDEASESCYFFIFTFLPLYPSPFPFFFEVGEIISAGMSALIAAESKQTKR